MAKKTQPAKPRRADKQKFPKTDVEVSRLSHKELAYFVRRIARNVRAPLWTRVLRAAALRLQVQDDLDHDSADVLSSIYDASDERDDHAHAFGSAALGRTE